LEGRMEYIEQLLGESADKHGQHASTDMHASLAERVVYLENCLGESADKHDSHKVNMEGRLEYVENLIGDNADKHWKEIEEAKGKLGNLHDALKTCANADDHSGVEERLGFLEAFIGESAAQNAKEMAATTNQSVEKRMTMECRLEYIEATLGDCADKHGKELEAAHGKLQDLHAAVNSCAKSEHHNTLEARMEYLESLIGDSADKHEKAGKDLEAAHSRVKDLGSKLSGEGALRDQRHDTLEERFQSLERHVGDHSENHVRKMQTLEAGHVKLKNLQDELNGILRGEMSTRDETNGQVDERLLSVENFLNQNFERQARDVDDTKVKLREAQAKLDGHRSQLDSLRSATDQLIERVEGNSTGQHFVEFSKDLDKRLQYMQEDQKRARDVLESSLQEQIRLEHNLHDDSGRQTKEHWERELKARLAYQDQYKDLIFQERTGRETMEQMLGERLQMLERTLGMETNRIWVAIDKHTHEGLKDVEVLQPQTLYEGMPPRSYEILPPVVEVMGPSSPRVPMLPMYNMAPAGVMNGSMSPAHSARMSFGGTPLSARGHPGSNGHMTPVMAPPNISGGSQHRDMSTRATIGHPQSRVQERARTVNHM